MVVVYSATTHLVRDECWTAEVLPRKVNDSTENDDGEGKLASGSLLGVSGRI